MAARALLFRAVLAASVSAASAFEEARKVSHFTGISISDGIEVHANTTGADRSSSLVLSAASPEVISHVRSYVDDFGTLILSRELGAGYSRVVARAVVPGPLTFAGATSGGSLFADALAGAVVVSSQSQIRAKTLDASKAVTIVASSDSSVKIDGGKVPYVSASASYYASMRLGELQADSATVTASSRSSITGMTVGSATVSVSSSSSLTMRATSHVDLSCASSEVRLTGGAAVTQRSNLGCALDLSGMEAEAAKAAEKPPAQAAKVVGVAALAAAPAAAEAAPVPPRRRLSGGPVLV